ncbi:MAG: 2-dehydropantoate 2-reductase [Verrucomicrobiota bacterium]|nr:2-dehydropantoate 2-reductase [Verrucomicrobiota bacterium]
MRARDVLPNFRIGVVGSGAIGSFYGAKLAYHGRDVHFLMRNDIAAVRKFGIRIRSKAGNIRVAKVNCYRSTDEIGPCDLVLIAIKTTSNTELLRLIPPLLHERTILLTLQNGFGNEEFLAENFGAERVLGGLCFVCLNRVAPGVIEHYDYGRVALGEYSGYPLPRTHDIAREFKRCGIVCSVVKNLALERWRKLVWNIPFNGLSVTAGGIDTAAILRDDNLRTATLALMDEVITVAGKCGQFLPSAEALRQMKRTEEMGAYKPSTLIDFEARKPLEIEAIWGEPLRRAAAVGAKIPRLELLYALLKERDRRNRLASVPVDLSRKSVAAENVTPG